MTAPVRPDEADTIKALLSLAASGVAADVVDGTEQERAAVQLGRQLGRDPGAVGLICQGKQVTYAWPADWQRAVRDYARGLADGAAVDVRRLVLT
jgi:hypothetical protein